MADPPAYETALAAQLATRRPSALDAAEDDLALLRARFAIVTTFIHNPAIALDIRESLARDLGIPGPETAK